MKSRSLFILFFVCLTFGYSDLYAWGVYGHQHIIKAAILALPPEMGMFFYNHSDFLIEESVVPDLRKYTLNDKAEFPRHFINLESYHYISATAMPQTMKEALVLYDKDSLQKHGTLPWYIQEMIEKLSTAMKRKSKTEILFLAGDLCHYIADAHMPLHTSLNHNGQLTGQQGIHAFWESQLPEMFGDKYNYYTGEAHYIENIGQAVWGLIARSHLLADTMLIAEKTLRDQYPDNKAYQKDDAGKALKNKFKQPVFSDEYATRYHNALNGMVEMQMRAAILITANIWYTAWVNAGKPLLDDLDPDSFKEQNKKKHAVDIKEWRKGKLTDLKINTEFK